MANVFLSYSTEDSVLAKLIVRILKNNKVECFLAERDINVGTTFDSEISEKIRKSNLLLLLWSSRSARSPWVNQEVGIAHAQDIPVWPIAIEEVDIKGPIFRNQGIYLTRHEDPYRELLELAKQIKSWTPSKSFKPNIDQFILGKEERTTKLIEIFEEELRKRKSRKYTLRTQGAFSCFSISKSPEYRVGSYHTEKYHNLLVREMEKAKRMVNKGTFLKVILWPWRTYDDRFIQLRFKNLIKFLEKNEDFEKVRFVLGNFRGPKNLYIFDTNVVVEGIKTPELNMPGYHFTTISFHSPTICTSIRLFDEQFEELWEEHAHKCKADPKINTQEIRQYVIEELRKLSNL